MMDKIYSVIDLTDTEVHLLPLEELSEAIETLREDLFVAVRVSKEDQKIIFWNTNLEVITIPFSLFNPSGDGTVPDFDKVSLTDYGQTVCFGEYEAATNEILNRSEIGE